METRTVTQVRVYQLIMNPMTERAESCRLVAIGYDRIRLEKWTEGQIAAEPYEDKGLNYYSGGDNHTYRKIFTKGGPLEWYNGFSRGDARYGHGIFDTWVLEDQLREWIRDNPDIIVID